MWSFFLLVIPFFSSLSLYLFFLVLIETWIWSLPWPYLTLYHFIQASMARMDVVKFNWGLIYLKMRSWNHIIQFKPWGNTTCIRHVVYAEIFLLIFCQIKLVNTTSPIPSSLTLSQTVSELKQSIWTSKSAECSLLAFNSFCQPNPIKRVVHSSVI